MRVGVCIPTADRPDAVERVLVSIAEQRLAPHRVVVVDASRDDATQIACRKTESMLPYDVLRYERCQRSLPLQRCRGIDVLRASGASLICMLDDDVTLSPDFLAETVGFLSSADGAAYGGVSGYDVQGWGQGFERLEVLYNRIGLFDGPLEPGRWLRCGRFLELGRLQPFHGVRDVQFVPGGHTVWRSEVFDTFQPARDLRGYALLEDKHLSLRVGSRFKLGVLGHALVWHDRASGGRPRPIAMAFTRTRREALLLRDCDPHPTLRRYAAFVGFTAIDLAVRAVVRLVRGRWSMLPDLAGSIGGWITCVLRPPGPTRDALVGRP